MAKRVPFTPFCQLAGPQNRAYSEFPNSFGRRILGSSGLQDPPAWPRTKGYKSDPTPLLIPLQGDIAAYVARIRYKRLRLAPWLALRAALIRTSTTSGEANASYGQAALHCTPNKVPCACYRSFAMASAISTQARDALELVPICE